MRNRDHNHKGGYVFLSGIKLLIDSSNASTPHQESFQANVHVRIGLYIANHSLCHPNATRNEVCPCLVVLAAKDQMSGSEC